MSASSCPHRASGSPLIAPGTLCPFLKRRAPTRSHSVSDLNSNYERLRQVRLSSRLLNGDAMSQVFCMIVISAMISSLWGRPLVSHPSRCLRRKRPAVAAFIRNRNEEACWRIHRGHRQVYRFFIIALRWAAASRGIQATGIGRGE